MDVDPATFLIEVYDAIDTFCADHPVPPHRGRPPRMSDSEVLTVEVLGCWHGTSERGTLAWIRARFPTAFPTLLSPSAFNRRARHLAGRMADLMHALAARLEAWADGFEIVDGLPVPVAQWVRGKRRRCFLPEEAELGHGGVGKAFYYGVSLLACVTGSGVITGFVTAPANDAERWQLSALLSYRHDPRAVPMGIDAVPSAAAHGRELVGPVGHQLAPLTAGVPVTDVYLADAGFAGADMQQAWAERYGATVLTAAQVPDADRHWFHHARQCIETVNAVLVDILHVRFPRARTEDGLLTRLGTTCAALNLGIVVNRRHHRQDLAHGTLFRG